ncbi:DUF3810 domain-containing protein [Gangjinia marincola]|uniref:DUF3810 domain-containing protein n=1 Tax=Gangjinia marincola TaxID=578463 RepID=A0ABN1MII3_9FLAO
MPKKRTIAFALFLPVQWGIIQGLKTSPQFVEEYYSNGVYPYISMTERFLFGWLPFSFGDLLYTVLGILLIRWMWLRIKNKFKQPKRWITSSLATLSIIYFCFHLFWGFNYYRQPLHTILSLERDYTTEKLREYTTTLIQKANALHLQLTQNDSLKVVMPYSKHELRQLAIAAAKQNDDKIPLTYTQPSVKSSVYSIPLTYMGFNGYLNPLTNEAQVNYLMPSYKHPTTTSHEIGHQLGFAKENEANFIACLNSMVHENEYFRYSGYTFALRYCLAELYRREPEDTEELIDRVNYGIRLNYDEVRQFWLAYQNPMEPVFEAFYGQFLKVNNQPQGMQSYSYVVALLVNYGLEKFE